jgi:fructokinase
LKAALITDGHRDLEIRTAAATAFVTPPQVTAVDTTGGGDAFIGAVLYGLSLQNDAEDFLSDIDGLQRLVQSAAHCGAIAVTRKGAFPSFPTFAEVEDSWSL